MPYIQELAALITIRNFLVNADENVQCKMSKQDSNAIRAKLAEVDRVIIEKALKLDPTNKGPDSLVVRSFSTSVDVNELMKSIDTVPLLEGTLEVAMVDIDVADEFQKNQSKTRPTKTKVSRIASDSTE